MRGSMTIEAALVLPLFLFFFANILFFFEMIRLESNMQAALYETGSRISEYAYFYRYGAEDLSEILEIGGGSNDTGEGLQDTGGQEGGTRDSTGISQLLMSYGMSFLLSETYVRENVSALLGREYLDHTCLEGGYGGVSYLRSRILTAEDPDMVDLVADFRVRPLFAVMAPDGFSLQARYYAHAWVGYDLGAEEEDTGQEFSEDEEIVYITPTGTVYHRSRDCTYLNPSVRSISAGELDSVRNESGGKYYPCEACRPSRSGMVLITSDGNRFHNSMSCRSLKRTVIEVTLSAVEDTHRPCSRCGGG